MAAASAAPMTAKPLLLPLVLLLSTSPAAALRAQFGLTTGAPLVP